MSSSRTIAPNLDLATPRILAPSVKQTWSTSRNICRDVQRLAAVVMDDEQRIAPLVVAMVACIVSVLRRRDRVRLAVSAPFRSNKRDPSDVIAAVDLPIAADAPFQEWLHDVVAPLYTQCVESGVPTAARAVRSENDIEDTEIDALVSCSSGSRASTSDTDAVDLSCANLIFDFVAMADGLKIEVRATSDSQRLSAAVVIDVFAELARTLCSEPATKLDELRCVSAALRRRLLIELNGPPVPYAKDRTVLHLFEDCVARHGERPALTCDAQTLSYTALDGKANALAVQLLDAGVGRGDLVPIVTEGGLELPIAMIALMKAGAAFVPVDAHWPLERQRVIFAQLSPKIALYTDSAQVVVDGVASLLVNAGSLVQNTRKPAHVDISPESLIYGFFTSGSTGVPKCALNVHSGLLNRFLAMSRRFGARDGEVVLQNSRHVFDSSIWQLLWPLTHGGRVIIPQSSAVLDLSRAISLTERYGVTMTDFVPSVFAALVAMVAADRTLVPRLQSLRRLLLGGEEICARAVHEFCGYLPACAITNTYGPTEASIGCVFHDVRSSDGDCIPIGKPIDNCYVVLVDEHGRVVPPGVTGEILIGGDCLGLGYLDDEEKTRAAFIANAFPEIPGAHLYRTGDLGYYGRDGNVYFVGRQDQQIKLGGVRIELAEIETIIAAHSAVRAVKVLLEGDRSETPRLIAYVVAQGPLEPHDVKSVVSRALPSYCVPKQVLFIDSMPLTPNGKADRRKLATLIRRDERAAHENLSDTQQKIREIWLELLGLQHVGLHDDFFGQGGDSLLAIRLALRLGEKFGRKVGAKHIYLNATISTQSALLESDLHVASITVRPGAQLDPTITISPGSVTSTPARVFLTGATGFIGSHLLRHILQGTPANVVCLVRAKDDETAMARVLGALRHYCLESDIPRERITPLAGDLELPRFKLRPIVYDELLESVDTVIHNGALVNFLLEYPALEPANVTGTLHAIRFAAAGRAKRMHFISTLAACASQSIGKQEETESKADAQYFANGYGQSKSVAERLVAQARARGLIATTYRLGEVTPHSRTGIANRRALLDTVIRCCLKLRLSFETAVRVDYTPVDYIARFVTAALSAPPPPSSVLHLFHPESQPLETLFDSFRRVGFPLRPVSYGDFHHALRQACATSVVDPDMLFTLGLMPYPAGDAHECDAQIALIFRCANRHFSSAQALAAIDALDLSWPTPGPNVLAAYAAFHQWQFQHTLAPEGALSSA
jgi:amino acid adenylation domain-containing protein/thioester reductase-like protein